MYKRMSGLMFLALLAMGGGGSEPAAAAGERVSPNLIVFRQAGALQPTRPAPVVLRGVPRAESEQVADASLPSGTLEAAAGDVLWFVDEQSERLVACEPRSTSTVGKRVIRCIQRDLPVPLPE